MFSKTFIVTVKMHHLFDYWWEGSCSYSSNYQGWCSPALDMHQLAGCLGIVHLESRAPLIHSRGRTGQVILCRVKMNPNLLKSEVSDSFQEYWSHLEWHLLSLDSGGDPRRGWAACGGYGEIWPAESESVMYDHDHMSLLLFTNLSALVEAATVAPPPGTVIQSKVQVSPDSLLCTS